jgi:hypothetical protein
MRLWLKLIAGTVQAEKIRVRDDAEKQCIRAVCRACRLGRMAEWDAFNRVWIHTAHPLKSWYHCDAHGIYELRRIRNAIEEAAR